ncbi:MAG: sensor histidine kinase [Phycisphaerales bacterium]
MANVANILVAPPGNNAPAPGSVVPGSVAAESRASELVEIIRAYNQVTDRLRRSHELLHSEVERLQHELASANAALQRSKRLAALGEMAAGIAHEIRNPLASIQLYANMLEKDLADQPEQHDIAGRIASAVRGLDGIVNDVLTFSREMKVRRVEGSAVEAMERAAEAVGPLIVQHGIRVRYEGEDVLLYHDRDLLHQALVNLIRNACEAMPPPPEASEPPEVSKPPAVFDRVLTLGVSHDDVSVTLTIRDSGPGIGEADIDRIFNPFFTTRATGTGLGLAIVHRIIDAHGGTIAVYNDGGAVFTLTFARK